MKPLLIALFCASLAANALLLVRARTRSEETAEVVKTASAGMRDVPLAVEAEQPGRAASLSPEIISQLKANDPAAIVALRKLGFAEKIIRSLVQAQIDSQFQEREQALQKRSLAKPFWKPNRSDPAIFAARVDLRREKEAAMRRLLGDDYIPDAIKQDPQLAFLSPEKAYRVRQIEEDLRAVGMVQSTPGIAPFIQFPEDREKAAYLEKEKRSELSQVLSPDELFDYDLRASPLASAIRRQLAAFEPSEEEFRELFRLRQTAEAQSRVSSAGSSEDAFASRRELEANLEPKIEAMLGDERYADYKQANDADYRRFHRITTRLELPRQAAADAQALKTSIQEQRTKIMRDRSISTPAQRADQLERLAGEAEAGLRRILGDTGYEAYRQAPGNFLQRLKSVPPVNPPTKG